MAQSFDSIVRRFLIYRVVSRFSFYVPIYVVALLAAEFSFREIGGVLFAYGIATMAFGGAARRAMRRRGPAGVIARGEACKLLSNALIGLALTGTFRSIAHADIAVLVLAQIFRGVGYCFAASGDGSYLSRAAEAVGAESKSQVKAQAKSSSYMFMAFLVAGCAGAALYKVMPSLPFFMTSAANLVAAIIAAMWLAVRAPDASPAADSTADMSNSGRPAALSAVARINLFGYAFLRAIVLTSQLLILPVWLFLWLQIEVLHFGLVFGLYAFVGFLGGRFYPKLSEKVSQSGAVALAAAMTLTSMLALGLSQTVLLALAAPIGMFCAAGMLRPAFLPALSQAQTVDGRSINAVPRAERLFGALSAASFLAGGIAFHAGFPPQQIVLGSAVLAAPVLTLGLMLLRADHDPRIPNSPNG